MFKTIRVFTLFLALSLAFIPLANSFSSQNMEHDGSCTNCEQDMMMPMEQAAEQGCSQGDCLNMGCLVESTVVTALQTSALLFSELFPYDLNPGSFLPRYQSLFIERPNRPPIA